MQKKLLYIIFISLIATQLQAYNYNPAPCINNKNDLVNQEALDRALLQAIDKRDTRLAQELLHEGANPNARTDEFYSNSALEEAIMAKNTIMVKLLIQKGADTRTPNRFGDSPLLTALLFSSPAIIKLVLDTNPEMCIVNRDGQDAYDIALLRNEPEILAWITNAQSKDAS